MNKFSMRDSRWAHMQIGETGYTLCYYGCFIVSLAMLDGRTPDEVLKELNYGNAFNKEGMLYSDVAAKILDMKYSGKTRRRQGITCIAETDHYKSHGVDQHFFVWLGKDKIIDSLDGKIKDNPYHIVSYRLFRSKNGGEVDGQKKEEVCKKESNEVENEVEKEIQRKTIIDLLLEYLNSIITKVVKLWN